MVFTHRSFGFFALVIVSVILSNCAIPLVQNKDTTWQKYLMKHSEWQSDRISGLKAPLGYLSMVGLYWLEEGSQSFGSGKENDIIFPNNFANKLGNIQVNADSIHVKLDNPSYFTIDSENISESIIRSDADGKASMMNMNSYFWYVIKRGDRYGIRMKDTLADSRLNFKDIPSYAPSKKWIITGEYYPINKDSSISITNKVGITYDSKLMGTLSFEIEATTHQLLAVDGGKGKLFIVFADYTNGSETYGGGRFLYVDIPRANQPAILDFNRAENPICGFSDYATCPLPRKENFLPLAVKAGERRAR